MPERVRRTPDQIKADLRKRRDSYLEKAAEMDRRIAAVDTPKLTMKQAMEAVKKADISP